MVIEFDSHALNEWLKRYKEEFLEGHWEDERYKWEAIKQFQDNWDINSSELSSMLDVALSKTENLLSSVNSFPKGMILNFAKIAPDKVRNMFADLFDETKDVVDRIERFKADSEQLRIEYMPGAKNHYQDENTITTYLWLHYPDKYYIYKFGEAKAFSRAIGNNLKFIKGRYVSNLQNFFLLYDSVHDALVEDGDLTEMFQSCLDDDCYPDPEERTLTFDFGFYVSRTLQKGKDGENQIIDPDPNYDPGLSVEEWIHLLNDPEVFDDGALRVMKRMKDIGGTATCSALANKYGGHWNYYNGKSQAAAERVIKKAGLPALKRSDGSNIYWSVLYKGEDAAKDAEGVFSWTLHSTLSEALEKVDLSQISLYEDGIENDVRVWWLNANPKIWSFAETPVGEMQSYTLYNENGNKRHVFQNFLDVKPGDIIIGYESNPVKQIVALGEIVAGSNGKEITFKKTEALANPIDYQELRVLSELQEMEFFVNPNGSLFKVSPNEYATINDLIREYNPIVKSEDLQAYDKQSFLSEVYIDEDEFDKLERVLRKSKNLVLQGAPGTGKTFAAKRLAWAMMGVVDDNRIKLVQFHQNYSYEDFVMGYKPEGEAFKLKNGVFYEFCKIAESHPNDEYFFIIDEINRGNMSKIFGELLMLIEASHRGDYATLAYNGMLFSVPENLYIIGMMNTADRSLAMIDYALRRRFSFYEMKPAFNSKGFKEEISKHDSPELRKLIDTIQSLNQEIEQDQSLGKGFCIGHSYLCGIEDGSVEELSDIVELEIVPMLEEYWYDDEEKVADWVKQLKAALK